RLRDVVARVGDVTRQRARGHGQRRREVNRALGAPHATGEVAVRRADAGQRFVETTEGVARSAETCGASAGTQLAARVDEDVGDGLFVRFLLDPAEVQLQHVRVDLGAAGDHVGVDLDLVPLEDVGGKDHVGDL